MERTCVTTVLCDRSARPNDHCFQSMHDAVDDFVASGHCPDAFEFQSHVLNGVTVYDFSWIDKLSRWTPSALNLILLRLGQIRIVRKFPGGASV